jgi:hypothetical protein
VRRETSNTIRFVIEDLLPPIVKDSALFRLAARAALGGYVEAAADFRKRAPFLTEAEYATFYRDSPHAHEETDNSRPCVDRIVAEVVGTSVCDVGCGTGYLLRQVRDRSPAKPARFPSGRTATGSSSSRARSSACRSATGNSTPSFART